MKKIITLSACTLFALSANAQLSAGLIAHWTFTGHTNDITVGAHHATPYNITYGAGKTGSTNTAAYFNGSNSYAVTGYKPDLNLDSYTICVIIKPMSFYTGACQGNYILARGDVYSNGGYGINYFDQAYNDCSALDTTKEVFTGMAPQLAASSSMQYSPNIVSSQWYCVVATYNGTTAQTYVNGVLKSTSVKPYSAVGSSTDGLSIGAYTYGFPNFPYWVHGYIDDLRLYNRALSAAEAMMYCESEITEKPLNTENIEQYGQDTDINLFPNPGNGSFVIDGAWGNGNNVQATITNAVGQVVYTTSVPLENGRLHKAISLNNAAQGLYVLHLQSDNRHTTIKLTIE